MIDVRKTVRDTGGYERALVTTPMVKLMVRTSRLIAMSVSIVLLAALLTCSSTSGSIGSACSGNDQCTALTTASDVGICSAQNVCTRLCTTDQDCGCAAGSFARDHTCNVACIGPGSGPEKGLHICVNTCSSNADCNGSQTCQSITCSGLPCGFSTCA